MKALDTTDHYDNLYFISANPEMARAYDYPSLVSDSNFKSHLPTFLVRDFSSEILIYPILIGFLMICFIRIFSPKVFSMLRESIFNINFLNKSDVKNNIYSFAPFVFLHLNFILMFGLFFALIYFRLKQEVTYLVLFSMLIFFTLQYVIKFLVILFCSFLFNLRNEVRLYSSFVISNNYMLGVILLPLLFLYLYFTPPSFINADEFKFYFFIFIGGVILLIYLYRIGFIILYSLSNKVASLFHIILYICTIELLPYLLFGKFILNRGI